MKKTRVAMTLLAALAASVPAFAGGPADVGGGIILGEPIGGTVKAFLDDRLAVDFGAGLSDGNAGFWGDLLWHDWSILGQPKQGRLGLYFGAGPQIRTGSGGDGVSNEARFGIRAIGGLSFRPTGHPLEFFGEAGPLFRLTQGGQVDAVGGIGLRFYWTETAGKR